MKKAILLIFIVILSTVAYAEVSHTSSQIKGGQFQPGNYSFDGYVSIGIAYPIYPLSVQGNAYYNGTIVLEKGQRLASPSYANLTLRAGDGSNNNADILFQTDSSNTKVIIKNNGKVGIGVPNPRYMLDIESDDYYIMRFHRNGISDNASIHINDLGGGDSGFEFKHGNANLFMKNDGNVGIGTTNPVSKLDVAGGIKLGSDAICNSNKEGTLRYDSGNLEICNSTDWTQIQGSSDAGVPAGTIAAFNSTTCPTGWIPADGTGGTPDLRGMFIRGLNTFDGGSTTRSDGYEDPDSRSLGSIQADALSSHDHTINHDHSSTSSGSTAPGATSSSAGSHYHTFYTQPLGGGYRDINFAYQGQSRWSYGAQAVIEIGGTTGFTSYHNADTNPTNQADLRIDATGDHSHTISVDSHSHTVDLPSYSGTSGSTGGTEVRPNNVALIYCVKASGGSSGSSSGDSLWNTSGNNIYYNQGNVAIGLINPEADLHIEGNNPQLLMSDSDPADDREGLIEVSAGDLIFKVGDDLTGTPILDGQLKLNDGGSLYLSNASHTNFFISHNGSVGIGTTEPIEKLDIRGNMYLSGYFTHYWTNDPLRFYVDTNNNAVATDPAYEFYSGLTEGTTTGSLLTIDHDGNVGIGIQNPESILHLNSSNDINLQISAPENRYKSISLEDTTSNETWIITHRTDDVVNYDNELEFVFYDGSTSYYPFELYKGYVGIGEGFSTTRPSRALHIYDADSDAVAKIQTLGADAMWEFDTNNGDYHIGIDNSDSGKFKIGTGFTMGSNTALTIDSSSKVGIGTTDPTYKLHVKSAANSHSNIAIETTTAGYGSGVIFREAGTTKWSTFLNGPDDRFYIEDADADDGVYLVQDGTSWQSGSDIRLKDNVKTMTNVLDKLETIRGVEFDWKSNGNHDFGVIAQELEKEFPEAVSEGKDGMMGVGYSKLGVIAIQAVKELDAENNDLKLRISHLENQEEIINQLTEIICKNNPEEEVCK